MKYLLNYHNEMYCIIVMKNKRIIDILYQKEIDLSKEYYSIKKIPNIDTIIVKSENINILKANNNDLLYKECYLLYKIMCEKI